MIASASIRTDVEEAWRAVVSRDRALDRSFVYAVRTTGIYCRPSCPSRRPRRENVAFYASAADAERDGFRPCARCGPGSSLGASETAVRRALALLDRHPDERLSLGDLARRVGLSPFHLQRTFTKLVGLSPRAYQDARRLARFKARVRAGDTVGAATYDAGYGSSRGLYESARAGLGMTPAAYRGGGAGETIAFATVATPLGRLLVASTGRGVCAVALGERDDALEEGLRAEFPRATLKRDDVGVRRFVRAVERQIPGGPSARVPLDLRGTVFQLRVWKALRDIPRGETRSYGAVAASLGEPRAARAVARACATNRLALLVPCHRVVRGEGTLGGYRWGVERKRSILDGERTAPGRRGRARSR